MAPSLQDREKRLETQKPSIFCREGILQSSKAKLEFAD